MKKKFIQKVSSFAALSTMALAAFVAAPTSELCSILILDDVEIPESLIKQE